MCAKCDTPEAPADGVLLRAGERCCLHAFYYNLSINQYSGAHVCSTGVFVLFFFTKITS